MKSTAGTDGRVHTSTVVDVDGVISDEEMEAVALLDSEQPEEGTAQKGRVERRGLFERAWVAVRPCSLPGECHHTHLAGTRGCPQDRARETPGSLPASFRGQTRGLASTAWPLPTRTLHEHLHPQHPSRFSVPLPSPAPAPPLLTRPSAGGQSPKDCVAGKNCPGGEAHSHRCPSG